MQNSQKSVSRGATSPAMESTEKQKTVWVRYEGNGSKKWDGKVIEVEAAWLEEDCGQELQVGAEITMPWKGKGGKIVQWNQGVIVEDKEPSKPQPKKKKSKSTVCST